jgi:hypothetical protein
LNDAPVDAEPEFVISAERKFDVPGIADEGEAAATERSD